MIKTYSQCLDVKIALQDLRLVSLQAHKKQTSITGTETVHM